MFVDNRMTYLKREVMAAVASLFFDNKLKEEINRIPTKIIPRNSVSHRCCVEKDREIIKQRVIASLGFGLEDEKLVDESLLSDFVDKALDRDSPDKQILSFIDEACKACVRVNYYVTEVCRNCVAKPCITNCPKGAISSDEKRAHIDGSKCVNCGLCLKMCPYHAIVFVPVPCEEACPVGAISKNASGKEEIDYSKCIHCGKCIRACPFGAVVEKSQIIEVLKSLTGSGKTTALVAPAIAGQFPFSMKQLSGGLRELGFDYVVEVALGVDITAQTEAEEFIERMASGDGMMGTSCCPAYVEAVKKHAQKFEKYVSHAKTPMSYIAAITREKFPQAVNVFIGPCIAKRHEGLDDDNVDYVITFEELGALFIAKGLDVSSCTESDFDLGYATCEGRNFPVSGGVAAAVTKILEEKGRRTEITPAYINGFNKKSISLLNIYATGKSPGNLIEVMSCEGGCICGPGVVANPKFAANKLKEFVDSKEHL
ncbi:MAG TPA: monomeric [FeFe] hydrogenase [Spirochaetota bacterium]|nr:monomeric [FeFe] hydrogenase [Spirochaetota bacterium]